LLAIAAALALLLPAFVWAAYPAEVPRTGQTTCYDSSGTSITCAGTGQDGDIQVGVAWPNPRFVDHGDGTVSDNLTGLEWTKDANPAKGAMNWQQALDYVKTLNTGGNSDWRLPNVNELESLINAGPPYYPALPQGHPFTNLQWDDYWSSTSEAGYAYRAWVMGMDDGNVSHASKEDSSHDVWPVRAGQCGALGNSVICLPKTGQTTCYNAAGAVISCAGTGQDGDIQAGVAWPSPRFVDHGDTVTDSLTGLEWTKNANPAGGYMTWQQALDYVKTLNTGSHSDWRLPNRRELRSLDDYSRYNSALPQSYPFTNVQSGYYWSSTSYAAYTVYAWIVDMYSGGVYGGSKAGYGFYGYVWPVRAGQGGSFDNLVISKSGTGVGTVTSSDGKINCGSDCTETYPGSTEVTLTAAAASGSTFACWSGGGCSGTGQCVTTVTGNVTVNAVFNTCPAPDLTAPDGATIPKPAFSWTKANDVAWYNIMVWSEARGGIVASSWFGPTTCSGSTCTAADLGTALPAGNNWWWLNVYYGDTACGFIEQPGGKWKLAVVAGCTAPTLTSPDNVIIATGTKPTFIFTDSGAEWYEILAWTSNGYLAIDQWVDESLICESGSCSVTTTYGLPAGTTNWWWLNTYSASCGFQMQPGGLWKSFTAQ